MFDVASRSETGTDRQGAHQRAVGSLRVSFKRRDNATVLDGLFQEGCLKTRFPKVEPDAWTTAVTLNTAGGIAGGDRLRLDFSAAPGTSVTIAAQAAERFYRALPNSLPAAVSNRITLADGAALEWLPQETILFDRCALERRLDVDLAPTASFLGMEALVFGRTAMGETVSHAWLRDLIRVRRGGRLLLHDAIRLDGAVGETLGRQATGAGARATATVLLVSPSAETMVDPVRDALDTDAGERPPGSVETGVSAWNGMLVVRMLAADGAVLRKTVLAALSVLRCGRPLPRVWNC